MARNRRSDRRSRETAGAPAPLGGLRAMRARRMADTQPLPLIAEPAQWQQPRAQPPRRLSRLPLAVTGAAVVGLAVGLAVAGPLWPGLRDIVQGGAPPSGSGSQNPAGGGGIVVPDDSANSSPGAGRGDSSPAGRAEQGTDRGGGQGEPADGGPGAGQPVGKPPGPAAEPLGPPAQPAPSGAGRPGVVRRGPEGTQPGGRQRGAQPGGPMGQIG